jgi:hypothetical protein
MNSSASAQLSVGPYSKTASALPFISSLTFTGRLLTVMKPTNAPWGGLGVALAGGWTCARLSHEAIESAAATLASATSGTGARRKVLGIMEAPV